MNNKFPDFDFQIDTTEVDADIEIQKTMLHKQYEERKKQEKIKQEGIDAVNKEYTTDELQTIEEKAKINTNLYLNNKFMYCYKAEVEENDMLGKCALHFMLGGLLREKRIHKSPYTWLDYRIHLILFQMSGTGKGMTAGFITRLLNKIKFPVRDYKTQILLSHNKWRKAEIICSGKATPESLINNYKMEKGVPKKDKNGIEEIKHGSLSKKDFFIYEEGGKLFDNSPASSDATNYFLIAMEAIGSTNNNIDKDLASFDHSLSTTSKSSIFIMTRPLGKIKKIVAQSGFFQRCLFIPRDIPYYLINDMRINSGISDLNYMGGIYNKKNDEFYKDLIEEFIKVVQFGFANEIKLNENHLDDIKSFFKTKMDWFYKDMIDDIISPDLKEIVCSLENRYKDNMLKLAFHSAVMRYSTVVDLEDIQYAFNIIKELYEEQKSWLYDSIEIDYRSRKENSEFKKTLLNIIKLDRNNLKTTTSIVAELSQQFEMDKKKCLNKIMDYSKPPYGIINIIGKGAESKLRIK